MQKKRNGSPNRARAERHRVGEGPLIKKGDIRLNPKEAVFSVCLKIKVAERTGTRLRPEFSNFRDVEFDLVWSDPNDTRGSLAAILLYAWLVSAETKTIRHSVKELVKEFAAQGWTTIGDVTSAIRGKRLNKGGRKKGYRAPETRTLEDQFEKIKAANPTLGPGSPR
jgi:hypothetical protein